MSKNRGRLRIAFLVNMYPVASETFIIGLVAGLRVRGHQLDIYSLHPGGGGGASETWVDGPYGERVTTFGEPKAVLSRIVKLPARRFTRVTRGNLSQFYTVWRDNPGIAVHLAYAISVLSSRPKDFLTYDIVHAQFGPNGLLAHQLRELGYLGGKLVTSFRGSDLTKYVKQHGVGVYKDLFAKGDMFLPVSEDFQKRLIDYGCPSDKVRVFRSGIDLGKFKYAIRDRNGRSDWRILTVARLVEKKGVEYALRGVALFRADNPQITVRYKIIGHGPLLEELKRLRTDLGLDQYVEFVGQAPHERVTTELEGADVFLLPSVTSKDGDEEGVPNVLKEAMAAGVPVIATQHSGIPELVIDRVSGLLVPERDASGIANALSELVREPKLLRNLAEEGRKCVERDYSLSELIVELESHYQELSRSSLA